MALKTLLEIREKLLGFQFRKLDNAAQKYRTCNKCRANIDEHSKYCDLGYERKSYRKEPFNGAYAFIEPMEPCPKPLTDRQLFESPEKGEKIC